MNAAINEALLKVETSAPPIVPTQKKYCVEYEGDVFHLGKQELRCLIYIARGFSTKEISRLLTITPRTVEFYLNNIKRKFHLAFLTDLRKLAFFIERSFYQMRFLQEH